MALLIHSAIMYPSGEIVAGRTHQDIIAIQAKLGVSSSDAIFGYIDSAGEFHPREEAKKIAVDSGQIDPDHQGVLRSEDLWPESVLNNE